MPAPFGGQSQQRWGNNSINAEEYLRDIMLTDLTGRVTGTADARRKGMLALVFFSTAGPVSEAALSCLQRMADAYKEAGKLTVLGVSEDGREATKALADKLGLKFPILLDHDGYHAMIYGISNLPVVYLADQTGLVVRKLVGFNGGVLNQMSARVAEFCAVEPVSITESDMASAVAMAA